MTPSLTTWCFNIACLVPSSFGYGNDPLSHRCIYIYSHSSSLQTIVSTALPTIASHFHASESGYSWIASSYMLANAATVPLWGKISDVWGRKRIILIANLLFLVGSLICALAIDLPMIISGRAIQGAGGGGITVLTNICVSDLFSVRSVRPPTSPSQTQH